MNRPTHLALRTLIALAAGGLALTGGPPDAGADDDRTTLADDAAAGVVRDREGAALFRPVGATRWTVADRGARLEPGALLKTATRGANALDVELAGGGRLLLGPAAQVELTSGRELSLQRGEALVVPPDGGRIGVQGPGTSAEVVAARRVLRAREGRLEALASDPPWLTGYEGDASTEAMGSLLAKVDGRDVPLTIGYHQVTVDVRDQIARTVVEQSFRNHTDDVLEGVFYFPLPQDASISGFAMWIGDRQVHGEIVEKQRARAIYEQILREKRDPGLLEWTGGNVFKARVYPIGREKRIKITYTQVLPKEGDAFTYRYALQSEMLRKHPLERLEVEVTVHSARPLADVSCPSHPARIRQTERAASVELSAEEYSPDRDFELRVALAPAEDPAAGGATVASHRRGDDGYLMLLLDAPPAPPAEAAPAEPVEVLLVADTSGSLAGPARDAQVRFCEALLDALGPDDRFDLLTLDTTARAAFGEPRRNTFAARQDALEFLEAREPLGWTDLAGGLRAAAARAGAGTHVVYVGDGAHTARDPDPNAAAAALTDAYAGRGTFHAVVPGSRAEPVVLRGIAALGGGSLRTVPGGDAAAAAAALKRELTAPLLKDLALDFEGVEVAAVYPERLPNLAAGTQQVVVARYDPRTAGDGVGRVVASGTRSGERIRFATPVTLAADEAGNAFIPRLWARRHLDHLLAQGRGARTRDRIVALSEDYQVITPYTSFLVLESEADRERFQVERRFRMRDGEEFFAAGRAAADHELRRQQLLAAKRWRRQLQADLVARLADMNRGLTGLLAVGYGYADSELSSGGVGFRTAGPVGGRRYRDGQGQQAPLGDARPVTATREGLALDEAAGETEEATDSSLEADDLASVEAEDALRPAAEPMPAQSMAGEARRQLRSNRAGGQLTFADADGFGAGLPVGGGAAADSPVDFLPRPGSIAASTARAGFTGLFPRPGGPRGDVALPEGWPEAARALAARLDRRAVVAGGQRLRIEVATRTEDARGRATVRRGLSLLGPDAWLVETPRAAGQAFRVERVAAGRRVAVDRTWLLGRDRPAVDGDAAAWPAPFAGWFGDHLASRADWTAAVEEPPAGEVEGADAVLVLKTRVTSGARSATVEERYFVDRERGLLLERRTSRDEVRTGRTRCLDPFEAGGAWWPGRIVHEGPDGAVGQETTVAVAPLGADAFAAALADAAPDAAEALLVPADVEATDLEAAKAALAAGEASRAQALTVLDHLAAVQRWPEADAAVAAFLATAGERPGAFALRAAFRQRRRRHEELKADLADRAAALAATPRPADLAAAQQLLGWGGVLHPGAERLALLDALRPVYARRDAVVPGALWRWERQRLPSFQAVATPAELRAELERLAGDYPREAEAHAQLARDLASRGEVAEAVAALVAAAEAQAWLPNERARLRRAHLDVLSSAYRFEAIAALVARWEAEAPEQLDVNVLQRYLSALVFLDREEEAWDVAVAWVEAGRAADALEGPALARWQAGVQHALGQGWNLWRQRIEPRHVALLAETARSAADRPQAAYVVRQVLQHHLFNQTEAAAALRRTLRRRAAAEVDSAPLDLLERRFALAGYLQWPAGEWDAVLDALYARWEAAHAADPDGDACRRLAALVQQHGGPALRIRRLRRLLAEAEGDAAARRPLAGQLLGLLVGQGWAPDAEEEALGLLAWTGPLAGDEPPARDQRLGQQASRLVAVVDWAVAGRVGQAVADHPERTTLTRRQLESVRATARAEARRKLRATLAGLGEVLPGALGPIVALERAWLAVKLGEDLPAARAACAELLAAARKTPDGEETPGALGRRRVVASRCLATLFFLAARLEDPAERAARGRDLLEVVDGALAREDDLLDWEEAKYVLLMVLDRPGALEVALAGWFRGGEGDLAWGETLGYVQAELDRLADAAATFEALAARDALGHEAWRALADWDTALDRPDAARRARLRSWDHLNEWQLAQTIGQEVGRYRRTGDGVPEQVDPELVARLRALFAKAQHPGNHVWQLQQLYQLTRDFRLLECVPEAVLGHSSQQIYPFLGAFRGVSQSLQEEATLDRLQAHLEALHTRAETAVDRRALRLLELQVAHRAATQGQGAGPHLERALAALRAAFTDEWEDGEEELYASHLVQHGLLQPAPLAEEQLRQLRALVARAPVGSLERLERSAQLAGLEWAAGRWEEALRTLGGALEAARRDGRLPRAAHGHLGSYSSYLTQTGAFAAAERLWLAEIEAGHGARTTHQLFQQLYGLYVQALSARARVSLGRGEALYAAVRDAITADLRERSDEGYAAQLVGRLCNLYEAAAQRRIDVADDARAFAFEDLPVVLDLYCYRDGQGMVGSVAEVLRRRASARDAVAFLAERAADEPTWLRWQDRDFWNRHARRLARAFSEAKGAVDADLEARVLEIARAQLRADLRLRAHARRVLLSRRHRYFWSAKAGELARVAHEVLDERSDHEPVVRRVADYLWDDLARRSAAIDALAAAHARGVLTAGGRATLVRYLQDEERWTESIPLLTDLVAAQPGALDHRLRLMRAFFHTDQARRVRAAYEATLAAFEPDAWSESVIAALAEACRQTELTEEAARLYDEAIALHVRSAPGRGTGDGALAAYYRQQADCYATLGRTKDAVDAAAGAIVAWGSHEDGRRRALQRLEQVLARADDLAAYVDALNRESDRTGLENPILRKALAAVYAGEGRHQDAVVQLRTALLAQPDDLETRRALVAAYDAAGQPARAAAAQLELARLAGHEVEPWLELARRLERAGQTEPAERARTNLIELMPNEAAGHRALAEVRQAQGRPADAALHWRHVTRVRSDEPPGWVALARALIALGELEEAETVIERLLKGDWDDRFGDVAGQAVQLRREVSAARRG